MVIAQPNALSRDHNNPALCHVITTHQAADHERKLLRWSLDSRFVEAGIMGEKMNSERKAVLGHEVMN